MRRFTFMCGRLVFVFPVPGSGGDDGAGGAFLPRAQLKRTALFYSVEHIIAFRLPFVRSDALCVWVVGWVREMFHVPAN